MNLDGAAAAARLLGYGTWQTGMCLNAVWNAFGRPAGDGKSPYSLARHGWENTPVNRRHTDRNPPLGAVVYFLNRAHPVAAGHIAIALGDRDALASTDQPRAGHTGRTTIAAIERAWGGRRYLGWSDYFLGHNIITGAPAAQIPPPRQSLPEKEPTMHLFWTTDGTGWLGTDQGSVPLPNPEVYNLFYRRINAERLRTPFSAEMTAFVPGAVAGKPAEFHRAEREIMEAHTRLLQAPRSESIDPLKLASALAAALGGVPEADVSPEALAAAYTRAFNRIAAALEPR
ncbi:hypothetical protein [Mycetocola spongiae]|uniref:hypothetical protein n=1 Tax=Mycetocola spongiae TaxID=2859226 RepID=UPI001CF1D6EF|nr:hypothetical protein [Mycetocola spongiae]UCR88323.1 hypothetical protein KXZ72_10110 [Mycetocola spongiae]